MGRASRHFQAIKEAQQHPLPIPVEELTKVIQDHPELTILIQTWPKLLAHEREAFLTLINLKKSSRVRGVRADSAKKPGEEPRAENRE